MIQFVDYLDDPRTFDNFDAKAIALKAKIKKYINEALESMPEKLRTIMSDKCVLSGSSIASLYHGELPNDFDLWAIDKNDIEPIVKIIEENPDLIAEYSGNYDEMLITNNGISGKKINTKNAITLKNKIQFIKLADYETCRKSFDMKHCLPYYLLSSDTFVISRHQMDLISRKKIESNGSIFVEKNRSEKFLKRGWSF